MTSHTIREARSDEWREFRALRLESLQDSPDAFWETFAEASVQGDADWQRRIADLAGPETSTLIVALDEAGNWVGMIGAAPSDHEPEGAVHLFAMYVMPAHRGQPSRLGERLVDAALAWARGRDATAVILDVNQVNGRAVAFYRRLGFVEVGNRPFRDDPAQKLIVMSLGGFR